MARCGMLDRPITDTPVSVLDFETTGLSAGADRVVEVSVVRFEPGCEPQLFFDTLVNPGRPMSAVDIHGITDEDVADAPTFEDIAGDLVRAIHHSVVAAYNVYFDLNFLTYELGRVGVKDTPPHLCLMYLRPMMGLGKRCSLSDACKAHGINHTNAHATAADCHAAGQLWQVYLHELAQRRVRTFGELASLKSYKFVQSFSRDPLGTSHSERLRLADRLKARQSNAAIDAPADAGIDAFREYWDALKSVICDLQVTPEEVEYLAAKQADLNLTAEELRSLHAKAFATVILQFINDRRLDDDEARKLRKLHNCLRQLGWAPGD